MLSYTLDLAVAAVAAVAWINVMPVGRNDDRAFANRV